MFVSSDIKKIFIAAFRLIFADDADFPYNKTDPTIGKVLISTKYTDTTAESQVPQIIFSTIGYNSSPTSFNNNFHEEYTGSIGTTTADSLKRYTNIISFTMTTECISTVKAESEAVADRLFNYLTMTHERLFTSLNINIRGVQVSEAVPRSQFPQYSFTSTVGIQGDFTISWVLGPSQYSPMLQDIKYTLTLDDDF